MQCIATLQPYCGPIFINQHGIIHQSLERNLRQGKQIGCHSGKWFFIGVALPDVFIWKFV